MNAESAIVPATLSDIAAHLGLSRTAARDLETQGVISRAAGLDACRLAYLRHLRARRSHVADDELRRARAREVELRTAQRMHELIRTDDAMEALETVTAHLITGLLGLAARVGGRDLTLRGRIDDEVFRLRTETADWLAQQAQALRTTGHATIAPGARSHARASQ